MRMLARKLQSRRGETLIEVLAAVLVCTLSVLLLAYASTAAGNINHAAAGHDETYYEALNHAEARDGTPVEGKLTVTVDPGTGVSPVPTPVHVTVNLYGGEGVFSFAAVTPTPAPGEGGGP